MLAGVIVLLIGAAGFVFYEYRTHPAWSHTLAEYREKVTDWLAERKKNMHHGIAKVGKQSVENDDDDRRVNFEFYNTLQDMKSMSVDARAAAQVKKSETVSSSTAVKTVSQKSTKISHAAEIEKDLLAAMKKSDGGK
jgi:hypothetical protein